MIGSMWKAPVQDFGSVAGDLAGDMGCRTDWEQPAICQAVDCMEEAVAAAAVEVVMVVPASIQRPSELPALSQRMRSLRMPMVLP